MTRLNRKSEAGFTLTELLIVVAIMGLVVTAVMGLYVNMQKNTGGAEEVAEVQSGIRVGMDWIARDLRMAGFLFVGNAFTNAQNNTFTVNTASSFNDYARVGDSTPVPAGNVPFSIPIDPPGMLDMFKGGDFVRIVRPSSSAQPASVTFRITGLAGPTVTPRTVTLTPDPDAVPAGGASLLAGDMLVRVQPPADLTFPHTTTYSVADDPDSADPAMLQLVRTATTGTTVITGKITQLEFDYVLDDGTTVTAVPAADLGKIVAVRVVLTAATDATKTGQANYAGIKTRQLATIVKLRNL